MSNSSSSLSGRPQRASLLDVDPGRFRYSAWRNVTIGVWTNQATAEAAQRILRISKFMAREHPSGHSSVVFVLDGAPAPTPEANVALGKLYDTKFSDLACMAIVVEGGGFWASRIRSTITGLLISSPEAVVQMRVSDSIQGVVDWLPFAHSKRTGIAITAAELKAALTATRELASEDNGDIPLVKRP
ncbi:MAG: hypothetical protein RL701_5425 [Pseudomonadota bacterium]|jgi:hypothetical protein